MSSNTVLINTKQQIADKIKELKAVSGTHSPSIETVLKQLPQVKIEVDACFLSNPYATDLFLEHLNKDLIETNLLRRTLEFYPPQNHDVADSISTVTGIPAKNIFAGNGAIEAIQAVLHNFLAKKIVVIIPTFSSYYEFVGENAEVVFYKLKKSEDYKLNVEDYIEFVKNEKPDTIVLINPNNPNGGYILQSDVNRIITELNFVSNLIIDESFIHFAHESEAMEEVSCGSLIAANPNLIIVKSMSKDFGIAGLRAGYAIMNENRVAKLLKNGYLWNVSGLADYFFKLYANDYFRKEYDVVRKKYIVETATFLKDLQSIDGIKTYPSKANFALVEFLNETTSFDFTISLLADNGIYVRDCSDKIGLEGQFVRVASRTLLENKLITAAFRGKFQ